MRGSSCACTARSPASQTSAPPRARAAAKPRDECSRHRARMQPPPTLVLRSRNAYCRLFSTRSRATRMQFLARPRKPLASLRRDSEREKPGVWAGPGCGQRQAAGGGGGGGGAALQLGGLPALLESLMSVHDSMRQQTAPDNERIRWPEARSPPASLPGPPHLKILSLCMLRRCCRCAGRRGYGLGRLEVLDGGKEAAGRGSALESRRWNHATLKYPSQGHWARPMAGHFSLAPLEADGRLRALADNRCACKSSR